MVEIRTLGNFIIKINGKTVSEGLKKTSKLLQLLNLFIINVNKPMSINLICDSIWKEDNTDTNKALQNLIYRLRHIFEENSVQDCFVYNHRTYMLTTSPDWQIDVCLMEEYYNQALSQAPTPDEKIKLLERAVDLYNGEYMLNLVSDDPHTYAATHRYKRMFIEIVCTLSDLYLEKDEYDKMFLVCDKAIALEPLQEPIYLRIIKGMRDKGKNAQAVNMIEDYFDILYREMGIRASDTLNNIYMELKSNTVYSKRDVEHIINELKEINSLNKALYCHFDAFRDIYRYESRQSARSKKVIVLILIEINGKKNEGLPEKSLSRARKSLHECCMLTLRKGDVFADYSKSQIIIMLTVMNESDTDGIVSRLSSGFYAHIRNEQIYLKFDIQDSL